MNDETRCDFYDVCTTPNLWETEKEDIIKEVCETDEHGNCVHYASLLAHFESGLVDKDEERKRIKEYFKNVKRRREFLMNNPGIVLP